MREGKEKIRGSTDGKEPREGVGKEGKGSRVVVGWKERKRKEEKERSEERMERKGRRVGGEKGRNEGIMGVGPRKKSEVTRGGEGGGKWSETRREGGVHFDK
jgi:hypothetical protein